MLVVSCGIFLLVCSSEGEKRQFYVQVFVADIKFHEILHAGGKLRVLFCDATETELPKNKLSKRRLNALKSNLHSFTLLEANNFQRVLKLQICFCDTMREVMIYRKDNAII